MNWHDIKIFLQVARTGKLSAAATALQIDSSTVSRRLHQLEKQLNVSLFERGLSGHMLTEEGQKLLTSAMQMDSTLQQSIASLQGIDSEEAGNVRLGCTEAFGSFFIAPKLPKFYQTYPKVSIDILPLSRLVKLSKYEADIAVSVGQPKNTSMIVSKLCDYRLKIYASKQYLAKNPIQSISELSRHTWVGYVDDSDFSAQLNFLNDIAPNTSPIMRSTSILSQFMAIKNGLGLAVLPCFLADKDEELQSIFDNEIDLVREFWLMAQADRKRIKRIEMVWSYLKDIVIQQKHILMP